MNTITLTNEEMEMIEGGGWKMKVVKYVYHAIVQGIIYDAAKGAAQAALAPEYNAQYQAQMNGGYLL